MSSTARGQGRAIAVALAVLALAGCGASAGGPAASQTARAPAPAAAVHRPATAEQIAARMHLAGKRGYVAYTATSDPNHLLGRQNGYLSKVNWGDKNEVNRWGSIEVFASRAGLIARKALVSAAAPPFGDGYDYTAGNTLLRLGDRYTPAQARNLAAQFRKAA